VATHKVLVIKDLHATTIETVVLKSRKILEMKKKMGGAAIRNSLSATIPCVMRRLYSIADAKSLSIRPERCKKMSEPHLLSLKQIIEKVDEKSNAAVASTGKLTAAKLLNEKDRLALAKQQSP